MDGTIRVEVPEPELTALYQRATDFPVAAKALLNFEAKLNRQPKKVCRRDFNALHTYGYNDEQILEAVLIVGLAKYVNVVAFGLGTAPDFDPVALPGI